LAFDPRYSSSVREPRALPLFNLIGQPFEPGSD
jgi:hypothetical protein